MKVSFFRYFNANVRRIHLVDKRKSRFMRLINWCLSVTNRLHLSDIDDFIDGYGTTIWNWIFDWPVWDWDEKEITSHHIHELCHILLWNPLYNLLFLVSDRHRARYESICIQAEMLVFPTTATVAMIERRVKRLEDYGIPPEIAREELLARLDEVKRGKPHRTSNKVYLAYLKWAGIY